MRILKQLVGGYFLESNPTKKNLLLKLNQQFLQEHRKKDSLNSIVHVLVYKSGTLSLWVRSEKEYVQIANNTLHELSGRYETIKTIVHLPFLLKAILQSESSVDLAVLQAKKNQLTDLCATIQNILAGLVETDADAHHQKNVLQQCLAVIKLILKQWDNGKLETEKIMGKLLKDLNSEIVYGSKRAAEIQMQALDAVTGFWIKKYNIDLYTSRVVIVGTHGPRQGLIEKQYFVELYQQRTRITNAENDTVYYAESLPRHLQEIDIQRDLIEGFLRNAETNKEYGRSLNGDSKAMFRDVLSDYGPLALQGLFGIKRQCPVQRIKEAYLTGVNITY